MNARRVVSGIGGSVALTASFALPTVGGAPAPVNCVLVSFAPNTDWLATRIMATNTACSTARGLATAAKKGPASFSLYAFACTGRTAPQQGLPHLNYTCDGPGGRRVIWDFYG